MGVLKTEYWVKPYEKLTFTDDFMFGKVMQNNRELCRRMIEILLDVKIRKIEYIEPQKSVEITADNRGVRFDAYVDDDEGTVYEIEMQTTRHWAIPKRSRYYQSMIDLNMLERGNVYDALPRSYVIFLCTFDPFGYGRHIYTFENICLQDQDIHLGDDTAKVFVSCEQGGLDDVSGEMKSFLDFLAGGVPTSDFTKNLDAAVKVARSAKNWRVEYMTLEMKLEEYKRMGKEEGREEGVFLAQYSNVSKGVFGVEKGAELLGVSVEEFIKGMQDHGYVLPSK
ncbi:MAG: Rpn family recombination-promoting nuclease/putative transposase [Lachnospiraceae bacterium]|nr:Rpn family recombination-promoting nuclease/putative transposase [Lachnospiraceae bacterium]